MADNLGGLFDSDPGFLEELASGADDTGQPQPQHGIPGMMQQSGPGQIPGGMMQQGYGALGAGMQQAPAQSSFQNMQYPTQQQQFQQQNFGPQYNSQQVYSPRMNPSQQPQGHINPMMSPNHRSQFAGQPVGHQMYPYTSGSSSQSGPRLPNPAQQQSIGQMPGWNQNPGIYNQQQQQQQQQYLPHNEYSIPNSSNQQMPHMQQTQQYPTQAQQKPGMYVQRMTSSGSLNRLPMTQTPSSQANIGMPQQMYTQQGMMGSQNFPNVNMSNPMTSDPMMMQKTQPQQQYVQQQQQQQFQQQFPYRSPPHVQQQKKLADHSMTPQQQQASMRFSQSSPTQTNIPQSQRIPSYNAMQSNMNQQPRPNVPMLSPRPTPPPPSPSVTPGMLSPTGSSSSHQGSFSQIDSSPNPNQPTLQPQQQNSASALPTTVLENASGDMNMSNFPFNQSSNMNQQTPTINQNQQQNVKANGPSGNVSPVKNVMSPTKPVTSPQNANIEIQNLNQQIQQLFNMPQTPNTQQKIHELQEKAQTLKSQQLQQSPRPVQQQVQNLQQQPLLSNIPATVQTPAVSQQQQQQQLPNSSSPQQKSPPNTAKQSPKQPAINNQQQQQETTPSQQQQQQVVSPNQQPVNNQQQQQTASSQPQHTLASSVQQPLMPQPSMVQAQQNHAPTGQLVQAGNPMPQGQVPPTSMMTIQTGMSGMIRPQAPMQPSPQMTSLSGPQMSPMAGPPMSCTPMQGPSMGISQMSPMPGTQMSPMPGTQMMPGTQIGSVQHMRPGAPMLQGQMQMRPMNQQGGPQNVLILQSQQNEMFHCMMGHWQHPGGMRMATAPLPGQMPTLTTLPQPVLNGMPQPQQQIVIRHTGQGGPGNQPLIIQGPMPGHMMGNNGSDDPSCQQEKANKIIAEAIAKAQKSGTSSNIPRVLQPPDLPATLEGLDSSEPTPDGKKPKKKRKYTPRKQKEPKEPNEKKKKKAKKGKVEAIEPSPVIEEGESLLTVDSTATMTTFADDEDEDEFRLEIDESGKEEKDKKPKKKKSSKTPKSERKQPKKPPATFLTNKKRKRRGSSDGSDIELKITPPPSPENEDYKRRSGRNVKRKKYTDDVGLNLSDEDTLDMIADNIEGAVVKPENPTEEDAIVVDKILGCRIRKPDPDEEDQEEVEEYFVKYKNFSYLHCEWRTEAEIQDKRIQGKIKRYRQKKQQAVDVYDDEEELFNPDYVEVDRVLEESKVIDPITQEESTHYLVKWRSLAYEDSTWELQQDVDPEKVKIFKRVSALPPEEEREHKARPKASDWTELKEHREYKGGNQLREYQLEGVNWLTFNWYKKQNCILADEMGLGKTIQSITFLQEMFNYGIQGPFLVVAPLSTIANWQREFETWTEINAITYHGTSPSRYMLQEYEMYYRDEEGNKITGFYKFQAIITTYEIILSDLELLQSIDWRCIIIDEAHRLKNKNCSLIKGLRLLDFEHKVLLSGTPLQNNVEELFSLLNFLEPSQFSSVNAFLAEFGNLQTEEQVDKLKAILKPMMLRRLKEDVEKNLAAKEETIIEVELTNIQKKYYRAILEKNFSYLCKGANSTNVPSLLNTMMELRKCCNHPYLLNGAEENILSELRQKEGREPEHIQALIQASGKFVLLDKLLPRLKQGGHRILIFSQMIRVLDIIEDYLIHKKYLYERLDGRIRGNLRQEAIDRYSKPDSDRFVFLICTKAGGLGINLTAADTVVIYDSDWNPQNDLQAQARCHRIGQSKMVKVYRLITRNSYEREMFNRASMKLGLDKAVLQSMGGDKLSQPNQQLTKREIEDLLRKGAYGALMDDDSAGDKFCEEDIEQILAGRTQVIQIESEGKGSTFSKASFSVTTNRDDIDINDADFWQKWARKADVNVDSLETRELIVDEPRVRKRTARYGNNETMAEISDLGSDSDSNESDEGSRKGRKTRRGRKEDEDLDFEKERHRAKSSGSGYGRSELFKVEKGLLHYGWGRWKDIMGHSRFKRPMEEKDIENVAKAILLYGLQYYKGDERIKEFISDLIAQEKEGGLRNHSGLSAPVPRGRKGKKAKDQESHFDANEEIEKAGIKMDRDIIYNKNAYKRHIGRHSNKVLLRVRTLYYLKHELLGDVVEQIDKGLHVKDINLPAPVADNEPPVYWWDELADKSLLVGTYKHGYEKYNLMRQDPLLVFLDRCGPPDGAALAAEMREDDDNEGDDMDDASILMNEDEDSLACASDAASTPRRGTTAPAPKPAPAEGEEGDDDKLPFPTVSEMNTRLRRIITTYQRDFKKQQLKQQQQAKKMEKREKLDAMFREKESRKKDTQQNRWTRREESDFYRMVSTYGIEFDRHKGRYMWDKFRIMAKLEKKTDEQLTEYFISFYHMCLRVCRKIKEEAYPPTPVYIEQITEERANRCIARIDLLSKIREEIVVHPKMEQRIKLCQKSLDLPSWWINGKHDRELLIGAAKHGLARTDYYIMNDPSLSFMDSIRAYMKVHSISPDGMLGKGADKKDVKKEKVESADVKKEEGESSEEKQDKEPNAEVKSEQSDKPEKTEDSDQDSAAKAKDQKDESDAKEQTSPEKEKGSEEKSDTDGEKLSPVKNEIKDEVKEERTEEPMEDEDDDDTDIDENGALNLVGKTEKDVGVKDKDRKNVKSEKVDVDKVDTVKSEKSEKVKSKSDSVKKELKEENGDPDEEVRLAMEGEDSQADLLSSVSQTLLAQWPKDRIVFHRLEQICYCIETGDWPFPPKMKNVHILGIDSSSNTPTRSLTPSLTPKLEEESRPNSADRMSGVDRAEKAAATKRERDFEGESLKMTFHKKEKNKRMMEEVEKGGIHSLKCLNSLPRGHSASQRIQAILAQSMASSQAASSDDSQQESLASMSTTQVSWTPWLPSTPPPPSHTLHTLNMQLMFDLGKRCLVQGGADSPFLNGSGLTEDELLMNRHLLEQGLLFPRTGRRGRKRKEEKMAELAMAEALARRQTARALAGLDNDSRVPLINLEDGSRLSGEEAPLKKNLETWLDKHPGFMVDSREEIEEGEIVPSDFGERRKGRKPKFDPAFLEVEKLTGEENVSVINRLTGKKITGAKAPPLRYLAEWLEQNPMWDVDPKWAELVRAKVRDPGSLPKQLLPRIVTPSRRGRRPRDSPLSHSMLGVSDPHQAAAMAASIEAAQLAQLMAAGFGKMPMPFGSIPGLGFNPMLGLPGFGLGLPGTSAAESTPSKSESKSKESKGSSSKEDRDKHKEEDKNASPHPSFPLMFNPLMYNPALLAAHGLANFPLPTSMAGLMDPGLINGHSSSSSKEETSTSSSSRREKSSHKKSELFERGMVEDLSIRSKRKEVIENTTEAHGASKPKLNKDMSFENDDMPCDLSMKSKSKEDKSKQKICSSDKLSRIVDTLKCRVNKMDEKPSKYSEEDNRRNSLDAALNLKTESGSSHREESRSGSSSKKDSSGALSHKHSPSSSSTSSHSNHTSKEPVPKIVQELLAAKQQRDHDELLGASKKVKKASSKSTISQEDEKLSAAEGNDSD
ncbi:chromodomain-helicase-DNA-binding protein 8-like isoform X4 [Mya arenaria]|uniref:chromodomain-helicase-DNA-binding protein 8-like isoform X4 n=1 Tax=Mya arenaria TaxID=6604 RepID=UPI0022E39C33|nr:chromodomain-helicase-DNA-binding protein 8-like isoform X4 [Mya arenaria]